MTQTIDVTNPQAITLVPDHDRGQLVHHVVGHLPQHQRNARSVQALAQCLDCAPSDFAAIARRHQVPPMAVTVFNHTISPTFQPTFTPTVEVNPVINLDVSALASSRAQVESSAQSDRFWMLLFGAFVVVLAAAVMGGD